MGRPSASDRAGDARAGAADAHPSDEALAALLDDGAADDSRSADERATRRHVAGCPTCTLRLAELRALRQVLHGAATRESALPRDLARGALERLRHRQGTVGRFNELVTLFVGFVRGLATLLADPAAGQGTSGPGRNGRTPTTVRPEPEATGATNTAGTAGGLRG
jgi:hypothetical protein